ncbi:NAD(P)H-binding protein [Sodalis sp. dw_96]|uniref:NAD(P)H-binding protein n=1 Tax=Sodalis sp. dw_96 TaxID=2719794 RepID=UPI001BD2ABFE|nr:NAD(P)H-binding protein [Sodalis sp. dw_96]
MTEAFRGGKGLFLLSAMTVGEVRQQQHRNAVDAAKAAGIEHINYTSFLGADRPDTFQVVTIDHRATEYYLQQSGLQWNTLRDNLSLENYLIAFAAIAFKDMKWHTSAGEGLLEGHKYRKYHNLSPSHQRPNPCWQTSHFGAALWLR